jgi:uncharacterized membrane protein YbhN (UPF0104 family)
LSPNARKWLVFAVKLAIVALLVWGVRGALWSGLEQLREHKVQFQPGWLVLSGALYLLGMAPACLFWRRVLRVLGQEAGLLKTIRAYYIGHLGKYVPGKALVVVLRAGMVGGDGVNTAVAAATVFIETLTMMASGSVIAAALIAVLYRSHWLYVAGAVLCMFAASLPTLPHVVAWIMRRLPVGQRTKEAVAEMQQLDYGTLAIGWIGTAVGWVITGLSLWATLRGIGASEQGPIDALPQCTLIVCISVVAGFMSMIPGGLMAREAVLAKLIEPQIGAAAVVSAIVLRLVWLAAELAVSAVLYFCRRWR